MAGKVILSTASHAHTPATHTHNTHTQQLIQCYFDRDCLIQTAKNEDASGCTCAAGSLCVRVCLGTAGGEGGEGRRGGGLLLQRVSGRR